MANMIEAVIQPPESYLFHNDPDELIRFELSSAGVFVVVTQEERARYFLAVQQEDQEGHPWGIPAGRPKPEDKSCEDVATRELREETGLELNPENLRLAHFYHFRGRGVVVLAGMVDLESFDLRSSITDPDGTIRFAPPPEVDLEEIRQLALIPLSQSFDDNLIGRNPYHRPKLPHFLSRVAHRSLKRLPLRVA